MRLPLADRIALLESLRGSVTEPNSTDQRLTYLADKMRELSGVDVRKDTREMQVATARFIFMFVARREGYSQNCIGRFIGRDHSTIAFAEKRMGDAFRLPDAYKLEIELYNKYIESL